MAINGLDEEQIKASLTQEERPSIYTLWAEFAANEQIVGSWKAAYVNAVSKNTFRETGHVEAGPAFTGIERARNTEYNDRYFVEESFEKHNKAFQKIFDKQYRRLGIKRNSAKAFYRSFNRARSFVFQALVHFPDVLTQQSFPATYFHKDIAMMFVRKIKGDWDDPAAKLGMFDPVFAGQRVAGTTDIILRTVYGAMSHGWQYNIWPPRTFASILMLAAMHNHASIGKQEDIEPNKLLYNQSSVGFTLLTFSYLPARKIGEWIDNENMTVRWEDSKSQYDWYFFWKALGSTMGLRDELLPDTHGEAEALWNAYLDSGEIRGKDHLRLLLDTEPGKRRGFLEYLKDSHYFDYTYEEVREFLGKVKSLPECPGPVERFVDNESYEKNTGTSRAVSFLALDALRYGASKCDLSEQPELRALVDIRHLLKTYYDLDLSSVVNLGVSRDSWLRALVWQERWPLRIRR